MEGIGSGHGVREVGVDSGERVLVAPTEPLSMRLFSFTGLFPFISDINNRKTAWRDQLDCAYSFDSSRYCVSLPFYVLRVLLTDTSLNKLVSNLTYKSVLMQTYGRVGAEGGRN